MKRLPIYGLLIAGYTVIIIGVIKLYESLVTIETINIPAQQQEITKISIVPLLIISVFVFIVMFSIGVYLLSELWKYLIAHKTILPIPFLLIGLGFLQLSMNIMKGVKVMIESNAERFTENIEIYINAFTSLTTYTIIGIACIIASVGYSFYLKITTEA